MSENISWYEIVKASASLEQGDFISECPVIIPPKEILTQKKDIKVEIETYNVIVMSQSCDLENNKVKIVLLCPYYNLTDVAKRNPNFATDLGKENLRLGHVFTSYLLKNCELEGLETDFLVVDIKNVFGLPIKIVKELTRSKGDRLRLVPPFREHLAQAFARFFMRVGLPSDIPTFIKDNSDKK